MLRGIEDVPPIHHWSHPSGYSSIRKVHLWCWERVIVGKCELTRENNWLRPLHVVDLMLLSVLISHAGNNILQTQHMISRCSIC